MKSAPAEVRSIGRYSGDVPGDGRVEPLLADSAVEPAISAGGAVVRKGVSANGGRVRGGDRTASLPLVVTSGSVRLLDREGNYTTDALADATETGLTPRDVDNDGALEIAYVGPGGYLKAVETSGTTWFLRNASGGKVPVETGAGVA